MTASLLETPLHPRHKSLGAKMAEFAGYNMPIQYTGIIAEHTHTRTKAGLFDVSHMGQCLLVGKHAAEFLESLTPGDFQNLSIGRMRYTLFLNEQGGTIDDLMVLKESPERFYLVVNAGRKHIDFALLKDNLPTNTSLTLLHDRALLALQGPLAAPMLARLDLNVEDMPFMTGRNLIWEGQELLVTRSGYTGEDGYEISVPAQAALAFADALTEDEIVQWAGLGARDSLRLEAGLCLYGHELNEQISPVEADLTWAINKTRRETLGFPGADRILTELKSGPAQKRVGILPQGKAPARENTEIQVNGKKVGIITSGGYGPTLGGPLAIGYVETSYAAPGTKLDLLVRGQPLPATVVPLPFVPHRYRK